MLRQSAPPPPTPRKAFTLIELLVVIAIIAILSVVVILTLNPAQLLAQSRDSNRLSELAEINDVLGIYEANSTNGTLGSASTTYLSIPDPVATSSLGDQCQGLGLPPLPIGDSYHCAASSTFKNVNGSGWIPVNFSSLSSGSPLGSLPVDPTNTTSSDFYFTYTPTTSQWELTDILEAQQDIPEMQNTGGAYQGLYQIGNDLNITPPFRSYGLVGYWPLDEGSGTVAFDFSGNGNTGTWSGTQVGSSTTYYSGGLVYPYAGDFDGSTDYVNTDYTATIGSGSFSISAWFDPQNNSSVPGGTQFIFDKYGSNPYSRFDMFVDASGTGGFSGVIAGSATNTVTVIASSAPLTLGTWYMGTFVRNAATGNISLYLNGVLSTSTADPSGYIAAGGYYYVGQQVSVAQRWFKGNVADVRIYNRALSAAEIQAIYNAE